MVNSRFMTLSWFSRISRKGRQLRRELAAPIVALATLFATSQGGLAAEVKVLSANVFTGVLDEVISGFEHWSSHNVVIIYGTAGNIRDRVKSGEFGDVAILTRPLMDRLEAQGKIPGGTTRDVARSRVALVVRVGATEPDIGSVEAFRRSLLAATSISYPDRREAAPRACYSQPSSNDCT